MRPRVGVVAAAAVLSAGLAFLDCTSSPIVVQPLKSIRVTHTWGTDPAGAARMHTALAQSLPTTELFFERSPGTAAIHQLERAEIDAAFTYSHIAYMAMAGQLPITSEPTDHIRAIATLPSRAVQVVVAPRSGITSIFQLRARRVSLGEGGGSTAPIAELVLHAYGIPLSALLGAERLDVGDAVRKLIAGELDAIFVSGYPNADIALATQSGAILLEVVGDEIDRFRTNYSLLKPTVIPAGTYPKTDRVIHTVGIDGIFICRTNLDEEIAYELTRAFVDVVSRGVEVEALRRLNLSGASSTAIPLHPGAARYYRERELLP